MALLSAPAPIKENIAVRDDERGAKELEAWCGIISHQQRKGPTTENLSPKLTVSALVPICPMFYSFWR